MLVEEKKELRLLLVEDNDEDEFLLLRHLKKSYKVKHHRVETGPDMRRALLEKEWDLIISDYSLPTFSGLEALGVYQDLDSDLPFIIHSGTIGEDTAVTALRSGAHDFILKGATARLLPAIEREMREFASRRARREAERRLAENERRFRSLIENALDIITVIDADNNISYVSPAVERVLGYRPEELVGRPLKDFMHPDDVEVFAIDPQREGCFNWRHPHKEGGWRILESMSLDLREDPAVAGVVVNSRDVTERQKAAQALKLANTRLQKALEELEASQQQAIVQERLRALGEMASGVAHDFNNALASILGFSEALMMYPELLEDIEQTKELLEMIHTAAQDGANVVDRLSEFYRHREKSEKSEEIDLNQLARQSVQITQPKWKGQALARGVQVSVETDLKAEHSIWGDPQELRQALTNLIFNGVDAMPKGGTLTLRSYDIEDHTVLDIVDTGTGMSEETKKRCLEPFFTTKGRDGTGMGLAMVYGIIRRHESLMEILSELGVGTTIRLTFPHEVVPESSSQEVELDLHRAPEQTLRVLVAESEPMVTKLLSTFLEGDGHQVTLTDCGSAALKAIMDAPDEVDLVMVSHALKEVSGEELAEKIKAEHPDKRVILVTAMGSDSDAADVILVKPFTLAKFREALGCAPGVLPVR